ncbi:hypothetical protein FBZ83_11964 [Azospirillum brasilense]|uniref:Uncharacterized protein n=1 Tax=Azospirillum brasilense TaxID=192 RepID=A0A560BUY4_AZOBR|nr:hypothetical protein [Azospirillum brasilense]TWA76413.1 hypothetical protein FBZ83_11964 [Azospirillum brasilense]
MAARKSSLIRLAARMTTAIYGRVALPLSGIAATFGMSRPTLYSLIGDLDVGAGLAPNDATLRSAHEDDIGRALSDEEWTGARRAAGDLIASNYLRLAANAIGRDLQKEAAQCIP